MTDERNPYEVLGVEHTAEPEAVATAYRALARSHHPDVSRAADAEARMAQINAAWTILRDPLRRAAYDQQHGITNGLREGRADNPLRGMQERARQRSAGPGAAGYAPPSTGSQPTVDSASGWRRGPGGEGAAGPPPGRPRGSVLTFGRHIGWSLGEIARVDPGYLQWLLGRPEGRALEEEIKALLAPLIRTADGRSLLNAQPGEGKKSPSRR